MDGNRARLLFTLLRVHTLAGRATKVPVDGGGEPADCAADPGPPDVEFNFPLVFMCVLYIWAQAGPCPTMQALFCPQQGGDSGGACFGVLPCASAFFRVLLRASAASSALPEARPPAAQQICRAGSVLRRLVFESLSSGPSLEPTRAPRGMRTQTRRPLVARLTPETREPGEGQMAGAGRGLVGGLVPVRRRLRTGTIGGEGGVSRRR